jgi:hypothetical protein
MLSRSYILKCVLGLMGAPPPWRCPNSCSVLRFDAHSLLCWGPLGSPAPVLPQPHVSPGRMAWLYGAEPGRAWRPTLQLTNTVRTTASGGTGLHQALACGVMLQGLPTAQQLAAQLPGAMRQVRQGAYLPAQGAGLASIGVAKLASLLKVPRCSLCWPGFHSSFDLYFAAECLQCCGPYLSGSPCCDSST